MQNSSFGNLSSVSSAPPYKKSDNTVATVSTSEESMNSSSFISHLPGKETVVRWDGTMNIRNDPISRCDDTLPRIQPSCLHHNDISQPTMLECEESKIPKPKPFATLPTSEKRISFSLKQTVCSSSDNTDAMETDDAGDDRVRHLQDQMEILEGKIQKAAQVELRYLQSFEKVRQKRQRWEEKHREAVSRRPRVYNETSGAVLESYISEAEEKIAKAIEIEKAYMRRVKDLHDKRYRWSKLYEHASRDLLEINPSRIIPSLPPLFTPSFLRR